MTSEGYCNVPLTLPAGWDPHLVRGDVAEPDDLAEDPLGNEGFRADAQGLADGGEVLSDRLFWFRWITGHQIALLSWRQAGLLLMAQRSGGFPLEDALDRAAAWLRTATAMYVYSASCPRETYHTIIRPTMTLWHAAFSGTWSVDFQPLPLLVAELRDYPWLQGAAAVEAAFHESRLVHAAAARKLVPTGGSLLNAFRRSGAAGAPADMVTAGFCFDSFFLVRRAEVSRAGLAAAFRERAARILTDLDRNGLYPVAASSLHEIPEGRMGEPYHAYAEHVPTALSAAMGPRASARGTA